MEEDAQVSIQCKLLEFCSILFLNENKKGIYIYFLKYNF